MSADQELAHTGVGGVLIAALVAACAIVVGVLAQIARRGALSNNR